MVDQETEVAAAHLHQHSKFRAAGIAPKRLDHVSSFRLGTRISLKVDYDIIMADIVLHRSIRG